MFTVNFREKISDGLMKYSPPLARICNPCFGKNTNRTKKYEYDFNEKF